MSVRIRFLPEAKAEFDAAADWYEQRKIGLGSDFVSKVRAVLTRIATNPKLHGKISGEVRKAVVQRFPYVVLYRQDRAELVVIAVFHSSREPSNLEVTGTGRQLMQALSPPNKQNLHKFFAISAEWVL